MVAASGCAEFQRLGGLRQDFVAAAVPLRPTLDHKTPGEIETRPCDEEAQRSVGKGRSERMGESRVERVHVLEIGEMRQMIAQDLGVKRRFERFPSQRAGLRTLAHRLENVDFEFARVSRPRDRAGGARLRYPPRAAF